jgi:AcrR family transcriptional regulator
MRAQILAVARVLFIREGYHGLALRQVSEQLGVTKAALYYHFKDKEALFMAILESNLDAMESLLDGILAEGGTCGEQIRKFVLRVMAQPAEERAIIRLGVQEIGQVSPQARQAFGRIYRQKFVGKVESILQRGIASGEFRRVDVESAVHTLLLPMVMLCTHKHALGACTQHSIDAPKFIADHVELVLSGLLHTPATPARAAPKARPLKST